MIINERIPIEFTQNTIPSIQLYTMLRGEAGDIAAFQTLYTAGENIGGHRWVYLLNNKVWIADNTNVACYGKVIGLTTHAVTTDASVSVQSGNSITELSWNWNTNSELFLGSNGLMTETPISENGVFQRVGYAISPTIVLISMYSPIEV